jgi:hypothetical protein
MLLYICKKNADHDLKGLAEETVDLSRIPLIVL